MERTRKKLKKEKDKDKREKGVYQLFSKLIALTSTHSGLTKLIT